MGADEVGTDEHSREMDEEPHLEDIGGSRGGTATSTTTARNATTTGDITTTGSGSTEKKIS